MEFDGETIEFDVFKENQNLIENQSISTVNMVNFFDVQELSELKENFNSKFVEGRSSTKDVVFMGRRYKRRVYLKESSYFPT